MGYYPYLDIRDHQLPISKEKTIILEQKVYGVLDDNSLGKKTS